MSFSHILNKLRPSKHSKAALLYHSSSSSPQICVKLWSVSEQNRSLVGRYRREMALRKQLHDRLVELLGNIRVLARVRPPITEDGAGQSRGGALGELLLNLWGLVPVLMRRFECIAHKYWYESLKS